MHTHARAHDLKSCKGIASSKNEHTQGEKSARALVLTEEMISLNQADYTAWQWRWSCLCALGHDITQEYAFTDAIMQVRALW